MAKVIQDNEGIYLIFCPGCDHYHGIWVHKPNNNGARWSFNNDFNNPTFNPSLLIKTEFSIKSIPSKICHSFIRNGKIQFLNDCTHKFAGKTVNLPDMDNLN